MPAAAGVLRHCRRQTITAFESLSSLSNIRPYLHFLSLSLLSISFSRGFLSKIFLLFAFVLFCLGPLIPQFNDLSINLPVVSTGNQQSSPKKSKIRNIHNRTRRITTQSRVRGIDMRGKRWK